MSNANDFIIQDGMLQRYVGHDEEVCVPDGVTVIGYLDTGGYLGITGAFANNSCGRCTHGRLRWAGWI